MKVFHIVPSLVKGSGVTEMLYQIHKDCYSKNIQNFFNNYFFIKVKYISFARHKI
mgnify:CR=1 FL=1